MARFSLGELLCPTCFTGMQGELHFLRDESDRLGAYNDDEEEGVNKVVCTRVAVKVYLLTTSGFCLFPIVSPST